MIMTYHIFGHQLPDTDAIVSALALQAFFHGQNIDAIAYQLGTPNLESTFLLDYAKHPMLPYLDPKDPHQTLIKGDKVCLTDHNESIQSIDHLDDFEICYVIDHHKLNLSTPTPAYVRIYPVGCTCTILIEMFDEKGLTISPQLATLMAGAIISDTLNLTSPITTTSDKTALARLVQMAKIDSDELADKMFTAKSDISHLSPQEIILADYKNFVFDKETWGISVIETTKPDNVLARSDELALAGLHIKQQKQLDYLLIVVVDIIKQSSFVLKYEPKLTQMIQAAFDIDAPTSNHYLTLQGVVSRKSQIVPAIENHYRKKATKA